MALLVADCPRCGSKEMTFAILSVNKIQNNHGADWQDSYEAFSVCRRCLRATTFLIWLTSYPVRDSFISGENWKKDISINQYFSIEGFVSQKDIQSILPPDHLPEEVKGVFQEAVTCYTLGCYNASSTMLRLALDLATRPFLPDDNSTIGIKRRERRDLGPRLGWLFDNNILPSSLRELASCVREDGNDAAHSGTITKADAEDLVDFSIALLERMYTEPARVRLAELRRVERRS